MQSNSNIDTAEVNAKQQYDHTKLSLFFDFQYKSLTETVNLLVKAAGAFYVTIMTALVGYLLTQTVSDSTRKMIITCAVLLTVCVFLVGIAICWGVILGVKDMRNTLKRYDEELFNSCDLESFFKRGRRVVLFSVITCVITMTAMVVLIGASLF